MKFAKQIENAAHDLPESWRPHLIHYKMLKKVIPLVVGELEARGLMEQSIPFEYQLDGKKNMTKIEGSRLRMRKRLNIIVLFQRQPR